MDLPVQVLDGPDDRVQGLVGAVAEEAGALPEQLGDHLEQMQLLLRKAGEEAPPQQHGGLRGQGGDLLQHPGGVVRVREYRPGIE